MRVNDILSELERQVGPLAKQSEKAKIYLKKKNELKEYDINMFLLEMEHIQKEQKEVMQNHQIVSDDMAETTIAYEIIKNEYGVLEKQIKQIDESIETIRENLSQTVLKKQNVEHQIHILNEQIRTVEMTDEHLQSRLDAIFQDKKERLESKKEYEEKNQMLKVELSEMEGEKEATHIKLQELQKQIAEYHVQIENSQKELITLLNNNASIKARKQKFDTMLEQIQIRKAEVNQRLLARKTEEVQMLSFGSALCGRQGNQQRLLHQWRIYQVRLR